MTVVNTRDLSIKSSIIKTNSTNSIKVGTVVNLVIEFRLKSLSDTFIF